MADLDPEGVVDFDAGDNTYRLFFGMRAMKDIERIYDKPFVLAVRGVMPDLKPEDLSNRQKIADASARIRLTDIATFFEVGLRKFQPEFKEEDAEDLADVIGLEKVGTIVGEALSAAMVKEAGKATDNPPNASRRKSKTGSRS